jgi:hypothetical protein
MWPQRTISPKCPPTNRSFLTCRVINLAQVFKVAFDSRLGSLKIFTAVDCHLTQSKGWTKWFS